MLLDISGKVAIVTGPGRGIGETIARRFAAEGTKLALLEREADSLELVAADLKRQGIEVEACLCDVSQEAQVADAIGRTLKRFGKLDILVNNAAVGFPATVEKTKLAEWEESFAVNMRGVMLCSRAVIPQMKKQRSGRIINASSFAAMIPTYAMASYAASKAAVVSFTRVLAAELGPWDITANAYAPGMLPTRLSGYADVPPARKEQLLDTLALRRWGDPNDIASLVIFLASDAARYITASFIDISGGKLAVQFPQLAHEEAQG